MATLARPRPIPEKILRLTAPARVAPLAILLLAMAFGGLGLNVLGRSSSMPAAPATVPETEAADFPHGDLPIIGDPIRDLTIWWSNRLTDANRAGLESLRGRFLTPIDPLAFSDLRVVKAWIRLEKPQSVAELGNHQVSIAIRP